jgi:hypothetical protein
MHDSHQDIGCPPPPLPAAPLADATQPPPDGARPVLAVVGEEGCYREVLDHGVALAVGSGAPLHVGVLHGRSRLTTDPALVAHVNRRLGHLLQVLHADLARRSVSGRATSLEVLTYTGSLLRSRHIAAWRAVDTLAETVRARLVIVPWELSEVAWSQGGKDGRTLVVVPNEGN